MVNQTCIAIGSSSYPLLICSSSSPSPQVRRHVSPFCLFSMLQSVFSREEPTWLSNRLDQRILLVRAPNPMVLLLCLLGIQLFLLGGRSRGDLLAIFLDSQLSKTNLINRRFFLLFLSLCFSTSFGSSHLLLDILFLFLVGISPKSAVFTFCFQDTLSLLLSTNFGGKFLHSSLFPLMFSFRFFLIFGNLA
ncbi:hypothetical protein AUEXF2481DRAFT_352850 [Aureobasidium subglaciale EXF-2481]|uniref:Uncharacterized protein n=1 Tax=Aureobasidium subglaciale (strain EXF-2481) TaxID=1043005 RepID=A0A074YGD0_AURSE|nr:uncharacterized protein AUEXF2481DRAFT_352850 [Aureobasidium subglaciale EXF-2481]KEQ93112.1 hypothetical protein AUEXF2481DRAFT_352850 [Aureobasidium subglaciale EXF-2481]